ncbi:MAG: hypothetical protein LBC38_04915 [Oscillospiraceae bacterium]|jgi:hypothetical protein|nr:hypothetical protein [Oscillospiraceae bacterium]
MKQKKKSGENAEANKRDSAVEQSTLDNALSLITREFGLADNDYTVSAFADKADSVSVTVVNADYELTVKIKTAIELGVK